MQISIRYNFRNPPQWARPSDQFYNRLLDQIEWADRAGFDRVALAEHHFCDDGFLSSLLPMAAAIAARTTRMRIGFEISLLPLYNPVRYAEDATLVDIISGGRLEIGVAAGYRHAEYEGLGMKLSERPGRMEEGLEILRKCWTEEEFSFEGKYFQLKNVRLMPRPVTPGGPKIIVGAGSRPAALRAARLGDDMNPMDNALWDVYYTERERLGRPVERLDHPDRSPLFVHVTEHPERDWEIIRPHVAYELEQYGAWGLTGASSFGSMQPTEETLRGLATVLTPDAFREMVLQWQRDYPHAIMGFYTLMAGMDPEMAQSSLELIAERVLPDLRAARGE